jgi:membrane dipeptidase
VTRPFVISHANATPPARDAAQRDERHDPRGPASGGVIGVCAAPFFLALDKPATLDTLIDHTAYIANLVGPAHVGLGRPRGACVRASAGRGH